ncbi:unnamed protein product [Rotaria sordida]|uniref:Uncharacterized protein n=1 Tax=Rotaria sordida TaxID=392033 RepID=A0A818M5V4_9BILA|nr:unnamed protein product [Rotaria sordida]
MSFFSSNINYNNSYKSLEKDNLSALYKYYQIDPQLYPPPDLQFNEIIEQSFYPLHLYFQPSRLENNNFSEQQGNISHNNTNNRQRFRNGRKAKQRLKSNRNRTKNNKQSKTITNNFHQRNIITVRRIPYHDMFNSQTTMKKQFEYEQNNFKNQWNKKLRSTNLIANPLEKSKNYLTEYNSPLPFVELQISPIESTIDKLLVSSSTTNHTTNIVTTLVSNTLWQQQALEKKMSKSMSMTKLKVISVSDSSTSSLTFTQLFTDDKNQTKPDIIIPGSPIDFETLSTPHLFSTPTPSSIVPYFSSTIAPYVLHHVLSSTSITSKEIFQTKPIIDSNLTNENNIHNLIDQLKICIDTLKLLLENKMQYKKYIISNKKSSSNEKISTPEKKQIELLSLSSSLISTRTCSRFSRQSISDGNDLFFKDLIIQRCNSFNNYQGQKIYLNILRSSKIYV